jgi:hypothetical protein
MWLKFFVFNCVPSSQPSRSYNQGYEGWENISLRTQGGERYWRRWGDAAGKHARVWSIEEIKDWSRSGSGKEENKETRSGSIKVTRRSDQQSLRRDWPDRKRPTKTNGQGGRGLISRCALRCVVRGLAGSMGRRDGLLPLSVKARTCSEERASAGQVQGCTSQVQYEWLRRKVPVPSAMDLYLRVTAGHCCFAEPKSLIGNLAPCGYEMGSSWSGRRPFFFLSCLSPPTSPTHTTLVLAPHLRGRSRQEDGMHREIVGGCARDKTDPGVGSIGGRVSQSAGPFPRSKKGRTSPLCISGNRRTGLRRQGLADRTWGKKHSADGAAVEPLGWEDCVIYPTEAARQEAPFHFFQRETGIPSSAAPRTWTSSPHQVGEVSQMYQCSDPAPVQCM